MRQGAKSRQMCVLKAMFGMFYGWAAIKYATNSYLCYFLWLCKRKGSRNPKHSLRSYSGTLPAPKKR